MGLVHFEDGHPVYYPYTPSREAGFAFLVLFAVATIIHIIFMGYFRTWYFTSLILGGTCEVFGYYGRAWAGKDPDSPGPFMLQLMLILISPVFIAATVYVTLSKLKQAVLGRPRKRCGPSVFFILVDIIAFCSQIGGGLVQVTGSPRIMKIGDDVVLAGLIFQLVSLTLYLVLVLRFNRQARRKATPIPWQQYVWVLAISTVAIWVRSLVRTIEFAQGFDGFVTQHEAMLYVFDGSLMLIVLVLLAGLHPGKILSQSDSGRTQKGENNELNVMTPADIQAE